MESSSQISKKDCSPVWLHEYIDGELSPEQEIEIEHHLASCSACLYELNLQKSLMGVLGHDIEPVLPKDFAEIVATKAESQVSGLRRRKERIYASTVAALLLLTVVVLLAFDVSQPIALFEVLIGKVGAFFALISTVVGNLAIGLYVIVRAFAQQADRQTAMLVFAATIVISAIVLRVVRSGKISHLKEVNR